MIESDQTIYIKRGRRKKDDRNGSILSYQIFKGD